MPIFLAILIVIMRLYPQQLGSSLSRQGLAPITLVTGDEPLQLLESADTIRSEARRCGVEERIVMTVATGFDWQELRYQANSLSLFGSRKLLELRLETDPGLQGSKALVSYTEQIPEDTYLLLTMARLEKKQQQSQWYKAIDKVGVIISVWPIEEQRMPQWIEHRFATHGIRVSKDAAVFLASQMEGNLLAAKQEVELLSLLTTKPVLGLEDIIAVVADNSRFDVFTLTDSVCAGDTRRALRILTGLQQEGIEPILVNWALARELRLLAQLSHHYGQGASLESLYTQFKVWDKRKPLIAKALRRHSTVAWRRLLLLAGRIDRVIKGAAVGNPWEELSWLCIGMTTDYRVPDFGVGE